MRILGIDLPRSSQSSPSGGTVVLLDEAGRVERSHRAATVPEVAASVVQLAGDEPFLLGVNVPVVVPAKASRARPIENLVRRRFGVRLPPGGRATLTGEPGGVVGETLMAGLAAAGSPCLPYPDRDRRRSGLIETYPALVLRSLLWLGSPLAALRERSDQPELFRGYITGSYRSAQRPARSGWSEQAAGLDHVLRLLETSEDFDVRPAREALATADDEASVEAAGGLLDAALIGGTARRYLVAPEESLFVGDREGGYLVLPADDFVRRLGSDAPPTHGRLFPQASLRQRLGDGVKVRAVDLLSIPGRPQRLEASFPEPPRYEFDNLDEMLWWKHARHLEGPALPTEGLGELVVTLGGNDESATSPLRLVRSRHRTLSFRFEPPGAWRPHLPTRDGRTYGFRVLRATYQTLASRG